MHWKHSNFDIAYLILGNCHTVDEGYRVLCELEEDRQMAIDTSMAESLRAQSKVVNSKKVLGDKHESRFNRFTAESFIAETKARTIITQAALDEARREIAFIRELKEKMESFRKYRNKEPHIAFQLSQRLEWRYDIFWQMYSQMCANNGQIESELFMLAKMHPDTELLMKGLDSLFSLAQNDFTNFLKIPKFEVLSVISEQDDTKYLLNTNAFAFELPSSEYVTQAIEYKQDVNILHTLNENEPEKVSHEI